MSGIWLPESWRNKPVVQVPEYPDSDALEAAENVQLELPISCLVRQQEAELMKLGHSDEDVSALHRQFERKS